MSHIALVMAKTQMKKEIADLELSEVKINRELSNLTKYAQNIADGTVTFSEMASCPSGMFGTQLDFMNNSSQAAYQSATVKANAYMQQLAQTNATTGNQYGYTMGQADGTAYDQATIFNEIYKEELKQYAEQMQDKIDAYEQELQQEKDQIEVELQEKRANLEAYTQQISSNIKEDAIRFGN